MRKIAVWLLCFFLIFTQMIHVSAEETGGEQDEISEGIIITEDEGEEGDDTPAETEIPEEEEEPSEEEAPEEEPAETEEPAEEEEPSEEEEPGVSEEPSEEEEPSGEETGEEETEESEETAPDEEEEISEEEPSDEITEDETPEEEEEPEEGEESEEEEEEEEEPAEEYPDADLSYRVYVSGKGWQPYKNDTYTAGHSGWLVEGLQVVLPEELADKGNVYVQAHVSNVGWTQAVTGGKTAGVTGQSKHIEALRLYLGGELSKQYDIWYRAYNAKYGWMSWTKNGGIAGSTGYGYAMQAIIIDLVKKDAGSYTTGKSYYTRTGEAASLQVKVHAHNLGWMKAVGANKTAGTTGQSRALEAVSVTLPVKMLAEGNVSVQAHVQNKGWMTAVSSGQTAGTTGKNLRMEAVRMYLSGGLAEEYDIWYRVHSSNFGWLGWTKNGEVAGTIGYNKAIEAIQVDIQPKGSSAHTASASYKTTVSIPKAITVQPHVSNTGWMKAVGNDKVAGIAGQGKRLEAFRLTLPLEMLELGNVSIQAHVQNIGWQGVKNSGNVVGTTGRSLRMEALKMSLTGTLASRYDIYYRTYVSGNGWLGWAKNGANAGSTGWSKAIEAVQICIAAKGTNPYSTGNSYINPPAAPVQTVPAYYSQTDGRWSGTVYGSWNMYNSGCVPTALAMIFSGISGTAVLPTSVASWLYNNTNDFNRRMIGASGASVPKAVSAWKYHCKGLTSVSAIQSELSQGRAVIAFMGAGTFASGSTTHAIVLFRQSNGSTYVYDPWTSGRNGWYSLNSLWNQRSTDPYDLEGGYVFYSIWK